MATAKTEQKTEVKIAVGSVAGFTPPSKPVRANAAKYPFDALEKGEFFSVIGKTKRQMMSPVSNANRKYRTEAKDGDGKVVSSTQTRSFYAVDVDTDTAKKLKGSEHEGATVLIVRSE